MTESSLKSSLHELRPLRGPALLLLVAMLVLILARAQQHHSAQTLHDLVRAERQGGQQVRDQQRQLHLAHRYGPRWRILQADPRLAARRSHWVKALRAVASDAALPAMTFRLSSARPLSATAEDPVQVHAMRLELELHHEFALVEFLAGLVTRSQGLFEIRGCRLRRHNGPIRFTRHAANVSADCTLWWLSRAGAGS